MQLPNLLLFSISLLLSVAFLTLLERKLLSYIQIRKGPNKVSMMGLLQPISDAIKLLNKSLSSSSMTNHIMFLMSPTLAMFLTLTYSITTPLQAPPITNNSLNMLAFLLISSMMVYPMIIVGWAPNSKFSNLGAIRGVAQLISYEISMFLIILSLLMIFHSFNMNNFSLPQNTMWILFGSLPLLIMWMTIMLAELNRTPFDFAEGESELVSGFNVEFMGGLFALIFLTEYFAITMMMVISMSLYTNMPPLLSAPLLITLMITTLWMRGSLPRFRFDLLMKFNWCVLLPLSIPIITFLSMMPNHSF